MQSRQRCQSQAIQTSRTSRSLFHIAIPSDDCGEELGTQAWITLEENKGALCLACADLDELVFLPTGDAALTRRARKHSVLSAVVLKFSKARGRYERQGLLVEENALVQAEAECLADADARERRTQRQGNAAQNWIALTCNSLPNEFENSFRTVLTDEKSKSLNTLAANTAGVLADRRRLRVSTTALYCWQWQPMCAIVNKLRSTLGKASRTLRCKISSDTQG